MSIKLVAILLLIPLFSFGQIPDTIYQKMISQTVVCSAQYGGNSPHHTMACGFIINEKYVGTCYHVYKYHGNDTLTSMIVFYNFKTINGTHTCDSVFADLNYKSSKKQYDFRKHIYIDSEQNRNTDFVVLKLKKKIKVQKLTFNTDSLKTNDILYALGTSGKSVYIPAVFKVLFYQHYPNKSVYIAGIGDIREGFSGAPVYDKRGDIAGMVQFGIDDKLPDTYTNAYLSGKISSEIYSNLLWAYKNGKRLSFSIPINYLIDHYLYGYLND